MDGRIVNLIDHLDRQERVANTRVSSDVFRPGAQILGLPKPDVEFSADLRKQLADLGMPRAFDDERAQFSRMAELDAPISIGRVLHKAKVRVDEKGTEAAAATVVEMLMGIAPGPAEPKQIICDRPYVFAIIDEASGAMLFLGVVNDPMK